MKTLLFFVTLLSLVALSAFAGGVGVGNGKRVYRSPEGFAVTYPEKLSLDVLNDAAFRISNAEIAGPGEEVSSVSFAVTKRAKTQAELAALVAKEHPGVLFAPLKLSGAEGLYSERRSTGALSGLYFLLTSNGDLVEITVDAYAEANGLAWVAPIVRTFAYDITPPTPLAVRVDNLVWPAGSKQKVRFRAVDDNAGVLTGWSDFVSADRYGADGKPVYPGGIFDSGDVVAEGDDWYSVEITVKPFVVPGDYTISTLQVGDRALNWGTLYVNGPADATYSYLGKATGIPVVRVKVTNSGPVDVTPPVFEKFLPAEGVWEAGTKHRIYFRMHDDVSGVDVAHLSSLGLENMQPSNGIYHTGTGRIEGGRDEGNGWYSIEVNLGPNLPTGEYYLDALYTNDRAGNSLVLGTDYPFDGYYHAGGDNGPKVPVWKVHVDNGGAVDQIGPRVEEVAVDTTTWEAGGTYAFRFRASDDLSGVKVGARSYGYLFSLADEANRSTIYLDQEIKSDGGDWYHIDLHLSPFMRAGEFILEGFYLSDRAGNGESIECDFRKPEELCRNANGPAIKPLRIRVVR